jgi:hypothetical protein
MSSTPGVDAAKVEQCNGLDALDRFGYQVRSICAVAQWINGATDRRPCVY